MKVDALAPKFRSPIRAKKTYLRWALTHFSMAFQLLPEMWKQVKSLEFPLTNFRYTLIKCFFLFVKLFKLKTPGKPGAPAFFEWFKNDRCQSDSSRAFIEFMIVLDSKLDLFEHYNVDCIFESMFLATLPSSERKGIGRWLTHFSYEFAQTIGRGEYLELVSDEVRSSGKRPQVFSAIYSSAFSQKIGRRLQLDEHTEVLYDDLYFKGISYAKRINNPLQRSAIVMAKKI